MKNWLGDNWVTYAPLAGVLLFAVGFVTVIVLQSRYPEIKVADQKIVGGKVIIDKAFLKSDGFVAIHPSSKDGQLVHSSSIGHVLLESGLNHLVEIRLTQAVQGGTKLFAVVHRDTDGDQRYEFGQGETGKDPIVTIGGEPVAVGFFAS